MQWHDMLDRHTVPKKNDILDFLGDAGARWIELDNHMRSHYQAKPVLVYSRSSDHPGWSILYEKDGRSLCTVYLHEGYFVILLVVHRPEEEALEKIVKAGKLTDETKELYDSSSSSSAGRWLMIEMGQDNNLQDVFEILPIFHTGCSQ